MNWKKILKYTLALAGVATLILLAMDDADARPGGGHSSHHSSGSHSSGHSGSGGGGGGDGLLALFKLLWVIWCSGPIGKIIVIALVVLLILWVKKGGGNDDGAIKPMAANTRNFNIENKLINRSVLPFDPGFSTVIFKDFVGLLFMRFMNLRGKGGNFNEIKPFFSDKTLTAEDMRDPAQYSEIAINSLTIDDARCDNEFSYLTVKITADYTRSINGKSTRQQSYVTWVMRRSKGAQTAEPTDNTRICCPHCGANEVFTDAGTCKHCGQAIVPGHSTWQVIDAHCVNSVTSIRDTFLNYDGSDAETLRVYSKQSQNLDMICDIIGKKSGFASGKQFMDHFGGNVAKPALMAIYNAWSMNQLKNCRHLLSDRQYESMKIWTDYLAHHGIFNKMDRIEVRHIRFVNASVDKYYDTITCEITISAADYMVDAQGRKRAGHTNAEPFKELFTFVRGAQAGKEFSITKCPSCGAPADRMGETAICEYCGSKISTGKFSWVLAGIEQVC